jgi:glyoxylase-like metal-dependent hydrolase (beta-lactamase superfamily II)
MNKGNFFERDRDSGKSNQPKTQASQPPSTEVSNDRPGVIRRLQITDYRLQSFRPALAFSTMIHLIDALHLGHPKIIGSVVVSAADDSLVMIDCGPESVFENVVAGLVDRGLDPARVRHLLLTHIHLDHSGGAWRWAKEFKTVIHVHPLGAPHLIEPSRLVKSAQQIYGEQMERLWGKIDAIPETSVAQAEDNTLIKFPGVIFQTIYTPGHAQHHNAYWLESEQTVFTGDVGGVIIAGGPAVPPCPPPDIHLETWQDSLRKLRALKPGSFHVTHFGRVEDPLRRMDEMEKRLFAWAEWMRDRIREGETREEILPEFQQFTHNQLVAAGSSEEQCERYEQANPAFMAVAGLLRYWTKHHPEALK